MRQAAAPVRMAERLTPPTLSSSVRTVSMSTWRHSPAMRWRCCSEKSKQHKARGGVFSSPPEHLTELFLLRPSQGTPRKDTSSGQELDNVVVARSAKSEAAVGNHLLRLPSGRQSRRAAPTTTISLWHISIPCRLVSQGSFFLCMRRNASLRR